MRATFSLIIFLQTGVIVHALGDDAAARIYDGGPLCVSSFDIVGTLHCSPGMTPDLKLLIWCYYFQFLRIH